MKLGKYTTLTFDTAGRIFCGSRRVLSVFISNKETDTTVRCVINLEDTNPLVLDTFIRKEDLDLCREFGIAISKLTDWPDAA